MVTGKPSIETKRFTKGKHFLAGMARMCLKQMQILTGFALFVVEFATAVCAGMRKGGLLRGYFTRR